MKPKTPLTNTCLVFDLDLAVAIRDDLVVCTCGGAMLLVTTMNDQRSEQSNEAFAQ